MNTVQTTGPFADWRKTVLATFAKERATLRANPGFIAWADQQPKGWGIDDCLTKAIAENPPALPLLAPLPAWVTSAEVDSAGFGEIMINCETELARDGIAVVIRQNGLMNTVTGEFSLSDVGVDLSGMHLDELTPEDARTLSALLVEAARIIESS